jgi:hypothetical protein
MVNEPHIVVPICCSQCKQEQVVQVRARTGFGAMSPQTVRCIKCERDFDVMLPDQILGGPFLP